MPPDYSGQNLRGRSFKGENLEGANFSRADIQSADFRGANLKGANFSGAKAGLLSYYEFFLKIILILLSFVGGFISAFPGIWITDFFFHKTNYYYSIVPGVLALIIIVILSFTIYKKGLGSDVVTVSIVGTLVGAGIGTLLAILLKKLESLGALSVGVAGAITAIEMGFILVVVTVTVTRRITDEKITKATLATLIAPVLVAILAVLGTPNSLKYGGIIVAIVVGTIAILLINSLAIAIIENQEKNTFFRNFLISFIAPGGTSFRDANLTDANFTEATLKSTDFRNATLTRTCFHKTKKLDLARPGVTYLQKTQVRDVLVTKLGQDKNFDNEDLRGINFQGANLRDASFINANLSEANLQAADLSKAKLVQAQLDGTDFTGATLTAVCIEDWNINSATNFTDVICDYIYLRKGQKERRPSDINKNFAPGESTKLFQKVQETVDLIFTDGIDWKAFLFSFQELRDKYGDENLSVQAIEKKSGGAFVIRLEVPSQANKAEIEYQVKQLYEKQLKILEEKYRFELKAKDEEILKISKENSTNIMELVKVMANRPIQNTIQNTIDVTAKAESESMSKSYKKQTNNDLRNAQFAGGLVNADTVNAGQIGGNITNYNQEQKQNLAQAAAEIQQLLQQLEQTNPTTTTSEKMTVVAKAVDDIEKNPTLKARVIGALKSGGTEAFKEAIDHPLVNILMASIEGWQEAE